jgi:hypothetical protein
MQAEQQLKASLKEIHDLKAALDEHASVAITDPQRKIFCVKDKFFRIVKRACELPAAAKPPRAGGSSRPEGN